MADINQSSALEIPLSRKITDIFIYAVCFCIFLHILAGYTDTPLLGAFCSLGIDSSIPTWYSAFALGFSSFLLALIAYTSHLKKEKFTKHWFFLSLIFLFMSIDEVATIHESLSTAMHKQYAGIQTNELIASFLGINPLLTAHFFYYPWVIFAIPAVLIIGTIYLRFTFALPKKIRSLFIIAGTLFVSGALGIEMFSGYIINIHGTASRSFFWIATLEEIFEMVSIVIFIHALLRYIEEYTTGIRIRIASFRSF